MWIGDVVANRFVIERPVGSGGMGTVFLAIDRATDDPVAVKVMDLATEQAIDRFRREASVLSDLAHPGIVRYIAHGETEQRESFLVMEFLKGEDLAERLSRGALSIEDCLTVSRHATEALAFAHSAGVVHRDVKPNNLFLVGGECSRVKVLDFGIARTRYQTQGLTQSGAMLGTVGYMAPEQAMGSREVDARADVFALGCVLFECLTGRAAFAGSHPVAVLAKVLAEDPPSVSEVVPGLEAFDSLVGQMLAKRPDDRPRDAHAVLRALEELGSRLGALETRARPAPQGLTRAERRIVSVIFAEPVGLDSARTVTPDLPTKELADVQELAARYHADALPLVGGALMLVLSAGAAAADQASRAASCALALAQLLPEYRVVVATGWGETSGSLPLGPVIDRAATLLRLSLHQQAGIDIDEVTAGLVGSRFQITGLDKRHLLIAKSVVEPPRTLLGKPTPCVGREKELALLNATLRECVDDSVERAVLVVGPAGQGKSRLCHEFLKRVREDRSATILTARADPVGAGSAFLLVRQLVRQAAGLLEANPAPQQRATLRSYVTDLCGDGVAARIADFLGELIGLPPVDAPSEQFAAARGNPQTMASWLSRSFGEWIAAASERGPLLLVLEDLHWGDVPSVVYLRDALRVLTARPLMLLALARPEVYERLPDLLSGLEKQEIALGRLAPRAAERLIRAALGDAISAGVVTRIVERADGNAFFLEELIRRVMEGEGETLPETVLALVASRLERLEPEPRRVVRAASVFGEEFWEGGAFALFGADGDPAEIHSWLEVLVRREILVPLRESRFAGELQYRFRHGLLREAAYAMLTEADRVTGHLMAGDWLERMGEKDALTMADHFDRGGDAKRAVPWLDRASRTAYIAGNADAAIALADRGIAAGAEGEVRGTLLGQKGASLAISRKMPEAFDLWREAMGCFRVGSAPWFRAAATSFVVGMFLGDPSLTAPVLAAIVQVPVVPEPSAPYGQAAALTCLSLTCVGQYEFGRTFVERAESIGGTNRDLDPEFLMHIRYARGFLGQVSGQLGDGLDNLDVAREIADRIGNAFGRGFAGSMTVGVLAQTGHCDRTEAAERELAAFCQPRGFDSISDWGTAYLGHAKVCAGRAAEAVAPLSTVLDRRDRFVSTYSRASIAHALLQANDLDGASREAQRSIEEGALYPITLTIALGAVSLIELRRGRAKEALDAAERGLQAHASVPWPSSGSVLRLARAEALHALGRIDEARAAIGEARERVLRIAATLDGRAELREAFVAAMTANARTIRLAGEWLGEGAG